MAGKQSFLQHLQSQYQASVDDAHCAFPAESVTSDSQTQLMFLNRYRLLNVQGPDSERFLQGQLSCDLREVGPKSARWGTYNNPKGRMHASFLISAAPGEANGYHLRMADDVAEHCREVLAKYIVFSKAEIESLADDWLVFAVVGPDAKSVLEDVLDGPIEDGLSEPLSSQHGSGWQCIAVSPEQDIYELHVQADQASEIWDKLSAAMSVADSDRWDKALIDLGMAEVRAQNCESLIPQMMNFDLNGGINFKKGCYTGQEVIARLHYRGEAKQRLFRIRGPQAELGTELFSEARNSAVGEVVAWYQEGDKGLGLAVIRIDSADQTLSDQQGRSFAAESLQSD